MDMHSRNQYLKRLQERYFQARSKKEKSSILDEYCRNTGQNRKYVIRKLRSSISLLVKRRGGKKVVYDGYVKAPLLKREVDTLRKFREHLIPHSCPCVAPLDTK